MVIFTPGNVSWWIYIYPYPSAVLYNKDFIICSLCAAEHTHCASIVSDIARSALRERRARVLYPHSSQHFASSEGARCSAVFGDTHFTARTVLNETLWGWVPKQLPPSLSDRVVLMRGLNSHPSTAVRREQGKLNCRDPQHQKHKKEPKLQVQISRDMQVSWSKLYPHNFWHMLSVLIPESLRSMIKLWPPQNHKMFEARRNLWRWSNPTVLLRAMSAGVAF